MREKIARYANQISDLTTRKAVQQICELIVNDLEDHKAKYDAHTHGGAVASGPSAGEQFQDVNLQKG